MNLPLARTVVVALLLIVAAAVHAAPLGTTFTYQGDLRFNGAIADGPFDFEVGLFTAATGGTAVDVELRDNVVVDDGTFVVDLDFTDAPFAGQPALFLELRVREGSSSGAFTTLTPRQPLRPTPYALRALSVDSIDVTSARPRFVERGISLGAGRVAGDISMAIGIDGLPILAVADGANADLLAVHCNDPACASSTITVLDAAGNVGAPNAIGLNASGLPIIAYHDLGLGDLKVAFCIDLACTGASTVTVDSAGIVGDAITAVQDRSTAVGFFYHDQSNGNLKVVVCGTSCTGIETVDGAAADVGAAAAAAFSGFRLYLAYHDQSTGRLLLKVCGTGVTSCDGPAPIVIDASPDSGDSIDVLVPADGLPLFLYTRGTTVRAARCTTLTCTALTLGASGIVGGVNRVVGVIGADGTPFLFTTASDGTGIDKNRCGDSDCASVISIVSSSLGASTEAQPAVAFGTHAPYVAFRRGNDLVLLVCDGNDCDRQSRR